MPSNVTVPIFRFGQPWGKLQVAFTDAATELAWARYGVWGLLAFAIPVCVFQFSFFLKKMVSALNPEGAIPGNVRSLLNTFAEGLMATLDDITEIEENKAKLAVALGVVAQKLPAKPVNLDKLLECCQRYPGVAPTEIDTPITTDNERNESPTDATSQVFFEIADKNNHYARSIKLETAAKDQDTRLALGILEQIRSIRSRIVSPVIQPTQEDESPIECALPLDDEDYREIVVDFIERLDIRLMGMLSLLQNKAFEELENEAHWLKGAGGTVGFSALTQPALDLMNAARHCQIQQCQESLRDILKVRRRFVLPKTVNPTVLGQSF